MNDDLRYIPVNTACENEGAASELDHIENTIVYSDDIEEVKSVAAVLCDLLKRQYVINNIQFKNVNNFAEIYIKDDNMRCKYINDVIIMSARNYHTFCDYYGGHTDGEEEIPYLRKDENGEFLDIHNFD